MELLNYIFIIKNLTFVSFLSRWIPSCAQLFRDLSQWWEHLIPKSESETTDLIQEFFSAVSTVMSVQLRSMVFKSLEDFLSFFEHFKVSSFKVTT